MHAYIRIRNDSLQEFKLDLEMAYVDLKSKLKPKLDEKEVLCSVGYVNCFMMPTTNGVPSYSTQK